MRSISVRVAADTYDTLAERAEERDTSVSHEAREAIGDGLDAGQLEERLRDREERIAELEDQLRNRSQVEEKVDVLATRVEDRERAADAPFFVKWARWFRQRDE